MFQFFRRRKKIRLLEGLLMVALALDVCPYEERQGLLEVMAELRKELKKLG